MRSAGAALMPRGRSPRAVSLAFFIAIGGWQASGSSTAKLVLASGESYEFPAVFLRENLKVSIDPSSLQRVTTNLPANLSVLTAEPKENRTWHLTFSDGAVGDFFLPPAATAPAGGAAAPRDLDEIPKTLWGGAGEDARSLQTMLDVPADKGGLRFSYESLRPAEGSGARLPLEAAQVRSKLFEALHRYGLAIVEGAPAELGVGKKLAEDLVGTVETTVYGYIFTVKAVKDLINLAYDSTALQQHTDIPYYQKPPDVQLFACLREADAGGSSLWLDGFAAAEALRHEDPEAFAVLTSTLVHHMDITDAWDLRANHPTLELDPATGAMRRVYFNERTRDSWRQWQPQAGLANGTDLGFYRALRVFEALVERREWYAETALKAGEVVLFDNRRVMHSRTAFEGERHMEGCYIHWDAVAATWRALQPRVSGRPYEYCGNVVGRGAEL